MSSKPYIIQEDSPNLVIVPTEICYDPPPKNTKQNSVQNQPELPTPIEKIDSSVFTNKTGANLYFSGRRINNDVLIDVSKIRKPPASWASNFLQSIGGTGTSPKFDRIYSSAPKLSLTRKENTQLNSSENITSTITSNINCQPNTVEIQPMMNNEKSQPKINLKLIKHKPNKPAPQSKHPKVSQSINPAIYTKENSQPNSNTKTYQPKSDTTAKTIQAQVRKEPSLPKGYRIPIQSKNNKHVSEPIGDTKPTRLNTLKESDQVNHNAKFQGGTVQTKYNKPETRDMLSNRENTHNKRSEDVKINKTETNQDKDSVKSIKYINDFHAKKIEELKTNNTTPQIRIKKDHFIINKETAHLKTHNEVSQSKNDDKEIRLRNQKEKDLPRSYKNPSPPEYYKKITSQFKNDDIIKQRNSKQVDLPRSYKNPCPPEYDKEIASQKSEKERSQNQREKEERRTNTTKKISKEKKEPTYSSKLKIKKCSESSKSTKHSKSKHTLESDTTKLKNQGKLSAQSNLPKTKNESINGNLSNKKNHLKLQKKKDTDKYKEDKKHTKNETNSKKSKYNNGDRSSKTISPIKSVVRKLKTDHNIDNKEKQYHKESEFHSHENAKSDQDINYNSDNYNSEKYLNKDSGLDLRKKLKRKIANNDIQEDQKQDRNNKKNKYATVPNGDRFVPEENLIISFDAKDDNEEITSPLVTENMSPKKKLARKKSAGGKKCKKIKLEINIVFDHADTSDEESVKSEEDEANTEIVENADFSFLDDFNVDEIVKSLNECKDNHKGNNVETHLTVNDAKAKGNQISDRETCRIEAVANGQCNVLINNETKSETVYCNNSSLVGNETNEHREMKSQPEVNLNRYHEEVTIKLEADKDAAKNAEKAEHIQYLSVLKDVKVKKEEGISKTMEGNTVLHVNNNSQNRERQTTPLFVAKSSSEHIMHEVKTEVNMSQVTELSLIKNSQDIEVQIVSNAIEVSTIGHISHSDIKNTVPMDISQDNITNHGHDSVLNEPTLTNIKKDINLVEKDNINNDSEVTSKINNKDDASTNDETGVIQAQTFKATVLDPDVIIIVDSDDENEAQIENNQLANNNSTALDRHKECTINGESDKIIILDATASENSGPRDTRDHNVGVEFSDDKTVLDATASEIAGPKDTPDQNVGVEFSDDKTLNTENQTIAESREDTVMKIDGAKRDKTTLKDTPIENKIKTSDETNNINKKHSDDNKTEINNAMHFEIRKQEYDNKEKGNLTKADDVNAKMAIKPSEELQKSLEESSVLPENSIPKAVPSNSKPQSVNTKPYYENKENSNLSNADALDAEAKEKLTTKTSGTLPKSSEESHVVPENTTPKAVPSNDKPHNKNTKPECDNKENYNSSNAKEINGKIITQTSEKLTNSPEKCENNTPKGVPPNDKPRNVNTTQEIKAQDKESPVNSTNNDKATKPNEKDAKIEIRSNIANDVIVGKLETKLLSFLGQKYTVTKLLRDGRFSKIYTCKDQRQCDFAVKIIKYESENSSPLKKQVMLNKLQNGVPENNLNCVRLIRGFRMDRGLWCFLMEYYPKNLAEALNERKQSFHIDEVQNLSRQLVSAVTILRNNNIIHSDIKPSHILINPFNTRIKLCGFDQASYYDGGKMFPNTGTVNYRAPELILGYPAGYEIDVWSTALVMYEMAANRMLFPGYYNNDILYKQLCTLGSVPMEMLMQSSYKYKHFKGTAFCRIIGIGKNVVIHSIRGNDILNNGLFQAYAHDWAKRRTTEARSEDKSKLCAFSKLLHSMLAMFPKNRIAIEFVFANPFIYETFDNC